MSSVAILVLAGVLATANAGILSAPIAPVVLSTGVPIDATQGLVHAVPVPDRHAPLILSGPAHIRIARGILGAPAVFAAPAPLAYTAGTTIVHSAAPIATFYHGTPVYGNAALLKAPALID